MRGNIISHVREKVYGEASTQVNNMNFVRDHQMTLSLYFCQHRKTGEADCLVEQGNAKLPGTRVVRAHLIGNGR